MVDPHQPPEGADASPAPNGAGKGSLTSAEEIAALERGLDRETSLSEGRGVKKPAIELTALVENGGAEMCTEPRDAAGLVSEAKVDWIEAADRRLKEIEESAESALATVSAAELALLQERKELSKGEAERARELKRAAYERLSSSLATAREDAEQRLHDAADDLAALRTQLERERVEHAEALRAAEAS